jgi:hypothetical protein
MPVEREKYSDIVYVWPIPMNLITTDNIQDFLMDM